LGKVFFQFQIDPIRPYPVSSFSASGGPVSFLKKQKLIEEEDVYAKYEKAKRRHEAHMIKWEKLQAEMDQHLQEKEQLSG